MRYTEKINEFDYKLAKYNDIERANARQKLGILEDLEEQLGCPLDVLFKALTKGIYIKNIYGEMPIFKCRLTYKNEELGYYLNIINGYVMVKDYKKTWWLKENREE